MAEITVGTTATALDLAGNSRAKPVLQNLGPGIIEVDQNPDLVFGQGIQVGVGQTYEFPLWITETMVPPYLISDTADTLVRVTLLTNTSATVVNGALFQGVQEGVGGQSFDYGQAVDS